MYDPVLLSRAQARLSEQRAAREARNARRRAEIYAALPAVAEIDSQMRSGLLSAVREAFSGRAGGENAMEACRESNLALRVKRARLLADHGCPADALDDAPDCALCEDTGFTDGKPCVCLRNLTAGMQRQVLDRQLDLRRQCFEKFDLTLYSIEMDPVQRDSPRNVMRGALGMCREYARTFSRHSDSLLLRGGPGLGKTFLCACIAGVVAAGPHWVIYETAAAAVGLMEADKFARDDRSGEQAGRLFSCDLLLLDDLGAEFAAPFALSALYQLLSARMTEHRPTIAVTVLTPEELCRRYPPQLASRLEAFERMPLFGEDLRRR